MESSGLEDLDVDKIVEEYSSKFDVYERLSEAVEKRLREVVTSRNLHAQLYEYRAKKPESLKEKILRPNKYYSDPLNEISDLAGVRIVTYFLSDVDAILSAIRSSFVVDDDRSVDYRKVEDPRLFDYASTHYIVRLSDDDIASEELSEFASMWCEIQVRTMLRHAWASIAHEKIYKPRFEPPGPFRRRFYALCGLLEIADWEFEALRSREEARKLEIQESLDDDNLDLAFDHISLPLYLVRKGVITRRGEPISGQVVFEILEEARIVGVASIAELDELLGQLDNNDYRALVENVHGESRRGGIALVRDALRLADPSAYLRFAEENRPGWHPRLLRQMCEGLDEMKSRRRQTNRQE